MRTTININRNLKERLKNTSEVLEISTHELIEILINTVISKDIIDIHIFNGVRYQKADHVKNWCKLHVSFEPQVYEQALDLRKCFKLSVSYIISYAITHFLDELVEKLINSNDENQLMDNYPRNYIFLTQNYNGIHGFIILWGIPEEKYLKNLLS